MSSVMDWDRAKQLIRSGQLDRLVRTDECTRRYREHKRSLGSVDVSTFVLNSLQWSTEELEYLNERKFATREEKIDAALSDRTLYKVTRNDFPYNFPADVHHLLIWSKISLPLYGEDSNGAAQDPETRERIEAFLRFNLETRLHVAKSDYCWFVNYSSLQSIKKISHIHLLVKTKDRKLIEGLLGRPGLEPIARLDGVEKTQKDTLSGEGKAQEVVENHNGTGTTA